MATVRSRAPWGSRRGPRRPPPAVDVARRTGAQPPGGQVSLPREVCATARLVDLSLPIYHEMPIWSGEPKTAVIDYFRIGRQAGDAEIMNMKLLVLCGHAGTHTDAPAHLRVDGPTLDGCPLERYVGPARVLDLTEHHGGGRDIDAADLLQPGRAHLLTAGRRLLLRTGWDRHLGTERYFDKVAMPKLTVAALSLLAERRVGLVGVDTPSVNPYLDQHAALFQGVEPPVAVELLTNLSALPSDRDVFLICLPLRIREGDGSPVRAVAVVEDGDGAAWSDIGER